MPGPSIHITVADRVADRLESLGDWSGMPIPALEGLAPKDLAAIIRANPHYYALGAIGPDLFFLLPDFREIEGVRIANPLIKVVEWLDDGYKWLDDWILTNWERYFGPAGENVEEAISRMTGDLSTVVQDILGQFGSIMTTLLLDAVTQVFDWFSLFSLGLDHGFDNQDFEWSDMLHYRRTSTFGQSLWGDASAETDEHWIGRFRAYALGYMTHLATDTTGHPFVNEKVGGPYRTHWQRHHLVENHMDARTYSDDHGSQPNYNRLTESALHYRIAFTDDGGEARPLPPYPPGDHTLRGLYARRRHLDLDSALRDEMASFLFDALNMYVGSADQDPLQWPTYSGPRIIQGGDGRPTKRAIQDTYHLFFRYLKMATLDGFNHEKPKPPDVFPNLAFPRLTDPHDEMPGEGDSKLPGWAQIVLSIVAVILWVIAIAVWLATIIPAIAADLATYIPRLIAYYCIELPLYQIVKAERLVMVMTGFMLPQPDEIDPGLTTLGLGRTDAFLALLKTMDDVLGNVEDAAMKIIQGKVDQLLKVDPNMTPEQALAIVLGQLEQVTEPPAQPLPDPAYPHQHPPDEHHHPWDYPQSQVERHATRAGPYQKGAVPHVLLDGKMAGDRTARTGFEHSPDPATTYGISIDAGKDLGDPVNFSSYLIWQLTRNEFPSDSTDSAIADWNLDGDRGYAYKCWDWNRYPAPQDRNDRDRAHHVVKDLDQHDYMEPCTPPPQSGSYDQSKDLEIHFADEPDPGCG